MIDAHIHIHSDFDAAALIRYLDREDIDACWLLTWEEVQSGKWPYRHLPVEDVLAAHTQYPERIVPMYAPDPRRSDCLERFRMFQQQGIAGCAELKSAVNWDDPQLQPLLGYLNAQRLPLVFHMEAGRRGYRFDSASRFEHFLARLLNSGKYGLPRQTIEWLAGILPPLRRKMDRGGYEFPGYLMDFLSLEAALQRYPGIRFIGHGPFFWRNMAADPGPVRYPSGKIRRAGIIDRLLREYDNLYADISGRSGYGALTRDRAFADRFLSEHASKLLFGSDNYFAGQKDVLDSLKLSPESYRRICHDNAAALVKR